MSNEDIEKVLNYNRNAVDKTIRQIMETNVINTLNFKKPKIVDSKDLYEFRLKYVNGDIVLTNKAYPQINKPFNEFK